MSLLQRLRHNLQHIVSEAEQGLSRLARFDDMTRLAIEVAKRRATGEDAQQSSPTTSRLEQSLRIVYEGGAQSTDEACATHLRYLCYALTYPYGPRKLRLIQDAERFPVVLAHLERKIRIDSLPKHLWRGLLDAHFQFDGLHNEDDPASKASHANWQGLRKLLRDTLDVQRNRAKGSRTKEWLDLLHEHRNLLSKDPCSRYSDAVLRGDQGEVDALKKGLRIPDQSWFWLDLLRAQTQRLIARDDQAFDQWLGVLLGRLANPKAIPDVLAALLTRYYNSQYRDRAHDVLRQTAVGAWGSPNLQRNLGWGHVHDLVRRMVLRWLSREDIEDFFQLLIQDLVGDVRRLKFWLRYLDAIQETHIVLGERALSSDADYVALRRRKSGRVSRLRGGKPEDNAFIMSFGDYVVVEFSLLGNAGYVYRSSAFPMPEHSAVRDVKRYYRIEEAVPEKELSFVQLKSARNTKARFIHRSDWETSFDWELARLGVLPQVTGATNTHQGPPQHGEIKVPSPSPSAYLSPSPDQRVQASLGKSAISTPRLTAPSQVPQQPRRQNRAIVYKVILNYARNASAQVVDNRRKGGALWVRHLSRDDELAHNLRNLGMQFTEGKGFWIY